MLVLSRRVGQKIIIGNDISVVLLGIRGEQVRLGILAPSNVRVDREEVQVRRREEADQAVKSLPPAISSRLQSVIG